MNEPSRAESSNPVYEAYSSTVPHSQTSVMSPYASSTLDTEGQNLRARKRRSGYAACSRVYGLRRRSAS
jgi:hypothetical protein